jgi:glycosyltransferase involved in cell wall biosynthesis
MKVPPRRPHVALFLPSLMLGGAQRVALNLARGLACQELRVDLVLGVDKGPLRKHVPDSVRLITLDASDMRRAVTPLANYLRREQPGCLMSRLMPANIAAVTACEMSGDQVRLVLAEDTHFSGRLALGDFPPQLINTLRWFYARADAVVAVSRGVGVELKHHLSLPKEKIHVIPDPVVDDHLKQTSLKSAPHPWLKQKVVPVIVSVGRLDRLKDPVNLLRAFSVVRRQRPAQLILFGEGPERPRLVKLIDDLGLTPDVDMPGSCPNPYATLRGAAAFALSSRVEGLPTALIEALACGCPVVATDAPCGSREVLQGGRYGELVPCGDPQAMAAALERILSGSTNREELRQRADRFSLHRILPQYLDVLGLSDTVPCREAA